MGHLLHTTDPLPWIANVVDDEVGIPAQLNAYRAPATDKTRGAFSQTIQSNWFSAACNFVKEHHMKGIYYWGSILEDHGGALLSSPDPDLEGELQPMAQRAIEDCFSSMK